jgi:hypothetical protein
VHVDRCLACCRFRQVSYLPVSAEPCHPTLCLLNFPRSKRWWSSSCRFYELLYSLFIDTHVYLAHLLLSKSRDACGRATPDSAKRFINAGPGDPPLFRSHANPFLLGSSPPLQYAVLEIALSNRILHYFLHCPAFGLMQQGLLTTWPLEGMAPDASQKGFTDKPPAHSFCHLRIIRVD